MSFIARRLCTVVALALGAVLQQADAVTVDTVPIGNPGNPADVFFDFNSGPLGAVAYPFRMGRTEVTNSQYVGFLNAVAAADPYQLYNTEMNDSPWGGIVRSGAAGDFHYSVKAPAVGWAPNGYDYTYDKKPVVFVSWLDTVRFANWLNNGQGGADTTEYGAYTLNGIVDTENPFSDPPSNSVQRNPGARWWLPNEDEWYKAAYYDPDAGAYHYYPQGDDAVPDNNIPANDTGNSANFYSGVYFATGSFHFPLTDAGAYALSGSRYGTFDQGGNVWEWNESLITTFDGALRGFRGGGWQEVYFSQNPYVRQADPPTTEFNDFGFRVATLPEPITNHPGLAGLADLSVVRIHEETYVRDVASFAPNATELTTRLANPLAVGNRDIGFIDDESYDVFYSDAHGAPNPRGLYLTIEGVWRRPELRPDGGMNIDEVELVFGGANPHTQFGDFVASFVVGSISDPGSGSSFVPGSEALAVDHNLATFPRFGQTSTTDLAERFRLTIGFHGISDVPEPGSLLLVALAAAGVMNSRRILR